MTRADQALADWLARIEVLHPRSIELGLERVRTVARSLALKLDPVVITVGGTNGKGSSCAMLESILLAAGYRVALYTSPHLVRFNERARINGAAVASDWLVGRFEQVEHARADTRLTYFEFTTLAILSGFQHTPLDVVILEVGLGGRLDAVNQIDADCAIVTSIDLDHLEYLGPTRESIGFEKAHIYRPGRPAICADPMPPASLLEHARSIGADLWQFGRDFNYAGDRQQWAYRGRSLRRASLAYPALRGANQLLNASGVLAALESLRDRLPVSAQSIRQGLANVELPGRFQVLAGRPAVILDVAHNSHAAAHLASNLDNMGFFPETWAVFGAMRDKDLDRIIAALGERIDRWLLADLPGERAAPAALLAERVVAVRGARTPPPICFASPRQALERARAAVSDDDRIVVFGSFLTVADILSARAEVAPARTA